MQPTVPSPECVGCNGYAQKRAPSDGKTARQGLVEPALLEEIGMRARIMRIGALMSVLGTLISLALAGGAGVQGW